MILKVGLTGGLASGKSTVARILAGLGCKAIDADEVVDRLYEPGEPGHAALVRQYGPAILTADGSIDRPRLARIAFATPQEAERLNALIHPLVLEREAQMIQDEETRAGDEDRIVIVEATLLLEAGGKGRYDRIVVVDADPAAQLERAVRRGMDRGDAERRLARQMDRRLRLAAADYVIDNTGDEVELERETLQLYDLLCADLARARKQ